MTAEAATVSRPSVDSASEHISHQAVKLRALIEDIAKTAPDAAKEKLESLKQGVASLCERGKDKTSHLVGKVTDTIKNYPLQTAAAAVGAGLLTWWLLSRRR